MRRRCSRGAAAGRGTRRSAARRPPASAARGSRSGPGASPKAPASVRTASIDARAGVGDAGHPQRGQPAVVVELDDVAGIEREARRRQPEGGGLAADPFLEQRPAAAPVGLAGDRGDGEALGGDAQRLAGRARAPRRSSRRSPRRRSAPATSAPAAARSPARGRARSPRRRHGRRPRDRRARASPPAAGRAAGSGSRPRSRPRRSRSAAPAARSRRAGFRAR